MMAYAHRNRQLFSNHFLERRLPEDPLWAGAAAEADAVRGRLRALLAEKGPGLTHANEAQTEQRWIRPVLEALGWGFIVQPRTDHLGATQFPDYALFPSSAAADSVAVSEGADHRRFLKRAAGVLEAKRWARSLDAVGGGADSMPNRVPSIQIINYLIRAEQPWGILTNGADWRLYHRDADFADTVYFSVDLPALLADEDLVLGEAAEPIPAAEAFRYFYLFFRPEAFQPDAEGLRWLDRVKDRSLRYARGVEDALRPRAYRAVTALCRGFAAAREGGPAAVAADPALGAAVLDNALTLLFRMLFVLYAESRELLPVRANRPYRNKSFLQLRDRAARIREGVDEPFPMGRDLWNDLTDLFAIIDGAEQWRAVGVPVYNGGLFDPDRHAWLEEHYVPDPHLAEAIDLLSRAHDPETGSLHQVDYAPLDVRQLGSIYEGLLEHVLQVAEADLPAIRERGQVVRDAVAAGELYLANDRGERKVSGSYYTPDYVVQYIVERTLGPLVEGRPVSEILDLRVLDPAMGSGHFLVAATSFLARQAVRAVAESDQQLLGDFAELDPEHIRRLVVERCIFGVDKNPRAVELAKLSLWIATVQKDKPLNFLDHHLKRGDSLLGARLRQLGSLPAPKGKAAALEAGGQVGMFDDAFQKRVATIVSFIGQIEAMPSDTLEDIERKERLYAEADGMLGRFRDVADVWASRLFGNDVDRDRYDRLVERLQDDRERWAEAASGHWFDRAKELWRDHHFFHWDLEFAEAFFDAHGRRLDNPGFDAVIGNPPYVRMEEFKELKDFLRAAYETYDTRTDLYVYFIERSLDLLRDGGQYGAILSNKFLRANYGRKVRALIGRVAGVTEIVDFGGLPVFPEATVRACVLVARKGEPASTHILAELDDLDFSDLRDRVREIAQPLQPEDVSGEEWTLVPAAVSRLLDRLSDSGEPLGGQQEICWGIKTGLNDAFIIDAETRAELLRDDPSNAEVIKPLVVGSDVRRYHIDRAERWLLYLPHGTDISRSPAVEKHLEPYRERLEARATRQEWYELQQPQEAYRRYFEGEKLVFPDMGTGTRFALDAECGSYPINTVYSIPSADTGLLCLLNSRLIEWWLRVRCAELEGPGQAYLRFFGQYIEQLPIRRIEPRTSDTGRKELSTWLQSLYYRGLKLAGLEPEVPEEIRALGPRLGEVEGVERVLLIGSWARGQAREDSDVDLVVVDRGDGDRIERRLRLRGQIQDAGRPVELHVYAPEDVEKWRDVPASFLGHVLREGVVLYES